MDPQPSWKKEHPMDTQVIQEKGLPMDSHNPSVRKSSLGTLDKGHLLFSLATGHGHPKNFPLQAPEAPHAPQALSTAPCSLSYLY